MSATHAPPTKRETLNLRIRPDESGLIDRAAASRGKNRSDFILEAARAAAEEALLEQVVMSADPEAYAAFLARLDGAGSPMSACAVRCRLRRPGMPWAAV